MTRLWRLTNTMSDVEAFEALTFDEVELSSQSLMLIVTAMHPLAPTPGSLVDFWPMSNGLWMVPWRTQWLESFKAARVRE